MNKLLTSLLATAVLTSGLAHADTTLLNVSYDVMRDFYKDYNPAFQKYWQGKAGEKVVIQQSHGGSSKQALSVANVAVVVSLADAASYATLPMIDRLLSTYTAERTDFYGATYVINQVDQSRKLSKDITQIMRGILGSRVAGIIHRDQSIAEALAYNQCVLDYDPSGQGCHDLQAIALNVLAKLYATQGSE